MINSPRLVSACSYTSSMTDSPMAGYMAGATLGGPGLVARSVNEFCRSMRSVTVTLPRGAVKLCFGTRSSCTSQRGRPYPYHSARVNTRYGPPRLPPINSMVTRMFPPRVDGPHLRCAGAGITKPTSSDRPGLLSALGAPGRVGAAFGSDQLVGPFDRRAVAVEMETSMTAVSAGTREYRFDPP
jgi:hypothetical protein